MPYGSLPTPSPNDPYRLFTHKARGNDSQDVNACLSYCNTAFKINNKWGGPQCLAVDLEVTNDDDNTNTICRMLTSKSFTPTKENFAKFKNNFPTLKQKVRQNIDDGELYNKQYLVNEFEFEL